MGRITRRHAIGGLSGVAFGALAAPRAVAADAAPDSAPLLIGPFAIDGWFLETAKSSPLGGPLEPLSTPKREDVAKILAGCRVYILDRRLGPVGKDARFAGTGYPKVAVEGKLAGEWRDGKKSFTLHVAEVSLVGVTTDYSKGLPCRKVDLFTVAVHLRGSDGQSSAAAVYHFSSGEPAVSYDIAGAVRVR